MSLLYEEIPLSRPPVEVLDTIRRSAQEEGWRVDEIPRGLLVVDRPSKRAWARKTAVLVEGVEAGTIARLLLWSHGHAGDGEMRRYILRLLNMPAPAYGPPGTPFDPAAPRDLYRPLGTGHAAPSWVRRATLVAFIVSFLFLAAFVGAIIVWGLPGLPFLWLAYMSAMLTRDLMLRRALAIRSLEGLLTDVLFAAEVSIGPAVGFVVVWILQFHHVF